MNQNQIRSQATINDWSIMKVGGDEFLIGSIQQHSRQDDFKKPLQMTSRVHFLDRESGLAQTENTLYRLGPELKRSRSEIGRIRYTLSAQ